MGVTGHLLNQVYNSDFRLVRETQPDFPDGWLRTGGDENTVWEWVDGPSGRRAIAIRHPSGPPAGVVQAMEVAIAAGELQRWEARVNIAAVGGATCYLRVYLSTPAGYLVGRLEFILNPDPEPETFSRIFTTSTGTGSLRLEVGIAGPGEAVIYSVEAYRLYPLRALRLDEKGRLSVGHVQTIEQILKPVRLAGPIPVNVKATVAADIRNLTPDRDGVRIYGSSPVPLATTSDGLAMVEVAGSSFYESTEYVTATATAAATAARDVSRLRLFSFAILNSGSIPALVQMEVSPDGSHWAASTPEQQVEGGDLVALVSYFFLRYARIAYRAAAATPLTIWLQGQG